MDMDINGHAQHGIGNWHTILFSVFCQEMWQVDAACEMTM